ncbi:MAG: hypothetical protein FWF56_04985 [Firmicutes bacterium]|nr:hypothetical protein [Bacillota bacterium]
MVKFDKFSFYFPTWISSLLGLAICVTRIVNQDANIASLVFIFSFMQGLAIISLGSLIFIKKDGVLKEQES